MCNCSIHLSKTLKEFYNINNLKILTIQTCEFNAIEIFFGFIKQKIYKKIFPNTTKLIKYPEKILEGNSVNKIICKIFLKTLLIYKIILKKIVI